MNIQAVQLIPFKVTSDTRGSLSEVFRSAGTGKTIEQWNCIRSRANVLRGMHAHLLYDELYVPVAGHMFFMLKDARASSPTFQAEQSFFLDDQARTSVWVPRGVAHGVYFETAGVLLYGLSAGWRDAQEYGFRWNDSSVKTAWPAARPVLSERDANAASFKDMLDAMASDLAPAAQ